ncbi:MAG: hypothetical protein A2W91_11440 [Bacteroidetes bacterium GWF2_38_335]|nr:MAG: hypothetical protein A2W91_11440 [Bacteroidetes bacterium GWF2_38_335]OFY81690.1 MAG: hypothetical protein A2281_05605 [Bacteroidetes bacterium RIFOXYA12_FULL_38_20]HBS87754.1 hypothetical protein [Bacteroidales bacterium]
MGKVITKIIIIIFVLSTHQVFSQFDNPEGNDKFNLLTRGHSLIGSNFNSYYSSNSVHYKFLSSLMGNKYIDDELKTSVKLKDDNRFGSIQDLNLYYISYPDSFLGTNQYGFKVSMGYHSNMNMKFGADAFNLAFRGNSYFAGKKADLSDLNINYLVYQDLQFGLFTRPSDDNPLTYYLGFSLIKGQTYYSIATEEAWLFTEETGEYLDLRLQGLFMASDSIKPDLLEFAGTGFATHLFFNYDNIVRNFSVSLAVDNFGYINWNQNSFLVEEDTSLHWEGIIIDDILNIEDGQINGFSDDTLQKLLKQEEHSVNFRKQMPERVQLSFFKRTSKMNSIKAGLIYLHDVNLKMPLFYIRDFYDILRAEKIGLQLNLDAGYGGYSGFQTSMGMTFATGSKEKNLLINASTNFLSFLIPKHTFSQNIFVCLSYRF